MTSRDGSRLMKPVKRSHVIIEEDGFEDRPSTNRIMMRSAAQKFRAKLGEKERKEKLQKEGIDFLGSKHKSGSKKPMLIESFIDAEVKDAFSGSKMMCLVTSRREIFTPPPTRKLSLVNRNVITMGKSKNSEHPASKMGKSTSFKVDKKDTQPSMLTTEKLCDDKLQLHKTPECSKTKDKKASSYVSNSHRCSTSSLIDVDDDGCSSMYSFSKKVKIVDDVNFEDPDFDQQSHSLSTPNGDLREVKQENLSLGLPKFSMAITLSDAGSTVSKSGSKRRLKRGGLAARLEKIEKREAMDHVLWKRRRIPPTIDEKSLIGADGSRIAPMKIIAEIVDVSESECNFVTVDCQENHNPQHRLWKILMPTAESVKMAVVVGKTIRIRQPWLSTEDKETGEVWIIDPLYFEINPPKKDVESESKRYYRAESVKQNH